MILLLSIVLFVLLAAVILYVLPAAIVIGFWALVIYIIYRIAKQIYLDWHSK